MHDLMETELEAMARPIRPQGRRPLAASATTTLRRRQRAALVARGQLGRALAGPLSPILDRAARRHIAAQGEQIDMPDVARRLRDFKYRLLNFLISPAVMKVVEATAKDTQTTPSAFLIKSAVRFGAEKAREKGWLTAAESDAVGKLAPRAIETALPAIIEATRNIGDGESQDLLEAELEQVA